MSTTSVEVRPVRPLYWSLRRELWENRSIYLAPLIVAAVVLIGFCLALAGLPGRMRAASAVGDAELRSVIQQPYVIAAIILMGVEILVGVFYCLDALYGERRDRSVLFWKSLPVSDLTAVLAKASVPILVLPLIAFVVTMVTQGVMLLASAAVVAASGISTEPLWRHVSFVEASRINLVHLVMFHGIWYSPLYAWLLLVSAWATRAPLLWAVLPPLAIGIVERLAFNSTHFGGMLRRHFLEGPMSVADQSGMSMDLLAPHPLGHLLASAGLWIGLVVAALFLLGAVRLRRSRGPI
jgi:ABC-2 type transport system permease protein